MGTWGVLAGGGGRDPGGTPPPTGAARSALASSALVTARDSDAQDMQFRALPRLHQRAGYYRRFLSYLHGLTMFWTAHHRAAMYIARGSISALGRNRDQQDSGRVGGIAHVGGKI